MFIYTKMLIEVTDDFKKYINYTNFKTKKSDIFFKKLFIAVLKGKSIFRGNQNKGLIFQA